MDELNTQVARTATPGSLVAPKSQSPMAEAFATYEKAESRLSVLVSDLEHRLEPVLVHVDSTADKMGEPDIPPRSDMTASVHAQANQLRNLANRLSNLLERLEI